MFRQSTLICGNLGKATMGGGSKSSLFYVLMRDYSPAVAGRCMGRLAKLAARYMILEGFTIGALRGGGYPGRPGRPHLHRDWAHPGAADVGGADPVTVRMWAEWPGAGADVGGVGPVPAPVAGLAHPAHICAGTGPALPTSAPGLGPGVRPGGAQGSAT
jgi:hypothetical protein